MSRCTIWVDRGVIVCKQWADRLTRQCSDWAERARRACSDWADQGYSACSQWADHGYSACDSWSRTCSDWLPWPLDYLCDAFEWVCSAWVWIANWVCVAWVWIAKWVCIAWYTIVEYVCIAWFWIIEHLCIVWSWVAKLVCIAWDTIRCILFGLANLIARAFSGRSKGPSRRIRHVFVLMLENRSFDHMLGFSDVAGIDAVTGQPTVRISLVGTSHQNTDPATGPISPSPPADWALTAEDTDPRHEFDDAVDQLAGMGAAYPFSSAQQYPPIDNSGFLASYVARGAGSPEKVMHVYAPEQLPILNTLANEFAVCDMWFSSIPGPTWPNRLFVHAASSAGLDDSPGTFDTVTTTLLDGFRFDNGSIYDRLDDLCLNWLIFEGDELPQVFSLSGMNYNALQGRFRDFEDFEASVTDPNFPAAYSFIEPDYGNILPGTPEDFTCGTSQHPLDDITRGEKLVKAVYEAIRNSPHWDSSLLVVTWDEHGGFYDHVTPPRTVHPGDSITDDENNHKDFDFTQLGVRVPAVVVSPLIPRGTIDHSVYDHSSVTKTVGELLGFSPLTDRDADANSFAHLLSLATPRTDTPAVLPAAADSGFVCSGDERAVMSDISAARRGFMIDREGQRIHRGRHFLEEEAKPVEPKLRGFLHVALLRHLSVAPISERDRIVAEFLTIKTNGEAKSYMAYVTEYVRAYKRIHPIRKPWLVGKDQRPRDKEKREKGQI